MEEEVVAKGPLLKRLGKKALAVVVVGSLVAFLASGPTAAVGAAAGVLAACFYAWGYIGSHVSRIGRERAFDPVLARTAVFRMLAVGLAGAAMYLVGRTALMAFLLSFAVAFIVLVSSEIPRVTRHLRARGVIGGR